MIQEDRRKFFEKYPDCKVSEPIECLSLVMRKEFAEAILRGEKTVEYRDYSQYYQNRIYDWKLMEYAERIAQEDMDDFVDFARPLRKVKMIHFHNYNNTWFLDVEVIDTWTVAVVRTEVEMLKREYNSDELFELLEDLEAKKATDRPIFFYFALGKVLGTDLKV